MHWTRAAGGVAVVRRHQCQRVIVRLCGRLRIAKQLNIEDQVEPKDSREEPEAGSYTRGGHDCSIAGTSAQRPQFGTSPKH
jgi:hypothetical protein